MSKRIRIRLYRVQDYDLVTLYYDKNFAFRKKLEEALVCFANERPLPYYSLKGVSWLPKPEAMTNGEKTKTGTKFVIVTSISIPDSETAAIKLVDSLASGDLVNNFLKSLIRRCFVDLEHLYVDETVRESYKDPGNAVSSRKFINEDKKQETTRKPQKSAPDSKRSETGEDVSAQLQNRENEPILTHDEAVKADNDAKAKEPAAKEEAPAVQEAKSLVGDLFSMADSFSY